MKIETGTKIDFVLPNNCRPAPDTSQNRLIEYVLSLPPKRGSWQTIVGTDRKIVGARCPRPIPEYFSNPRSLHFDSRLLYSPESSYKTPVRTTLVGGPSRDIPHRNEHQTAAQACPVPDDALGDRDHRTPYRHIHRALKTCSRRPPKCSASCRFSE
jgi:hypothetical protein